MPTTPKEGRTLSGTLEGLQRGDQKDQLQVGDLMEEIEADDGPGPVLFILTLPILLPTPPGVSMVLALPLLMVAPQIMAGRRKLWMPGALARRTIERDDLGKLLGRIVPRLQWLERLVHPRLQLLTGRVGASLVGLAATALAIVLVLPVPAANFAPAVALTFFALGLSRRDGLFVLAGYGVMALAAVVIWLAVAGFRLGFGHLKL